jgi:enterochelin esterase-like enzyme
MSSTAVALPRAAARRRLRAVVAALAAALFVAGGLIGIDHYLWGYWLYRGFAPPQDPPYVKVAGTTQRISITSAAIGGRSQQTYVYLPPGYDTHPNKRYPVLYLMHGSPGVPLAFILTVRVGVLEDALVAKHLMRPMILVMPFGSSGQFTDKEWANGIRPHEGWETFMARDVVRAIDRQYRTIPRGADRGLGGLSEGGFGALNIGLHHPGEFRVLESWSGYPKVDKIPSIYGNKVALERHNSPVLTLNHAAKALRRDKTYIWFYSGKQDPLHGQNAAFAKQLARRHVAHRFFLVPGGHNWAVWRDHAAAALIAASRRLAHA